MVTPFEVIVSASFEKKYMFVDIVSVLSKIAEPVIHKLLVE